MITILDGGMGQELIARSGGKATPMWSLQALLDAPELISQVHADYFACGATVATANTYVILPDRLKHYGIPERQAELMEMACKLAMEARDAFGSGKIAGSLGPLGFSYQPDKCPDIDIAAPIYETAVKQQSDFVDFHILETMSSVEQARGGLMGASISTKPVWLAISVDDQDGSKLRSGEHITEVLPLLKEFGAQALLVNCSSPEAVTTSIPLLVDCGIALGAYANGFVNISESFNKIGSTVDVLEKRKDLTPSIYADFAEKWVAAGATLVGGCCEVGPMHIKELSSRLRS